MPKYRIPDAQKITAIKGLILAVLGPPRYNEVSPEGLSELYPNIPFALLLQARNELLIEGKIEQVK